jgi:predicted amidophosphoribosyltransferase
MLRSERTKGGEKIMSHCPCCGNSLLRHIRHGNVYWFCQTCWAEMPNLELVCALDSYHQIENNLSSFRKQKQELIDAVCV